MSAARAVAAIEVQGAPGRPLAFTGFWVLVGSVGPLVLTNASDTPA